jgi:hypothetical protein
MDSQLILVLLLAAWAELGPLLGVSCLIAAAVLAAGRSALSTRAAPGAAAQQLFDCAP